MVRVYIKRCMYTQLITLVGEDKRTIMICPQSLIIHHYKVILGHFYGRSMTPFHHFVPCHIQDMYFKRTIGYSENILDMSIVCKLFQVTIPCTGFLIKSCTHPATLCVTVLINVLYANMTTSRPNCPHFICLIFFLKS